MASMAGKGEGTEGEEKVNMVTLGGVDYKPLADGHYDVVILGSGFKECLLAGLLAAVGGKKVLQIDRNDVYGGDCGTLDLESMCKRHGVSSCCCQFIVLFFFFFFLQLLLFSFPCLCPFAHFFLPSSFFLSFFLSFFPLLNLAPTTTTHTRHTIVRNLTTRKL